MGNIKNFAFISLQSIKGNIQLIELQNENRRRTKLSKVKEHSKIQLLPLMLCQEETISALATLQTSQGRRRLPA